MAAADRNLRNLGIGRGYVRINHDRDKADEMTPRRLAERMFLGRDCLTNDGFVRETFTLPRDAARPKAREIMQRYPAGGYSTTVEFWRKLEDGQIEFTMRRLPTGN